MRALAHIIRTAATVPGAMFQTEAEAWDMAARIADEATTYVPTPYAGRFILNAYDETGFWLGRL